MAKTSPENTQLTPLDICNLALSRLGESPIPELYANGSLPSRMCYMHYHPVRREVLCANRWSFATVRTTLNSAEQNSGDFYVSVKFTGPSYVPGSTSPDGVFIDRILLAR